MSILWGLLRINIIMNTRVKELGRVKKRVDEGIDENGGLCIC